MRYRIKRGGWAWALAALMLGGSGAVVYAQSSEIVTVNALQWSTNSRGWCETLVAGAVAINMRATQPVEIPDSARYIEIMHVDLVNPSQPFCARLGGTNSGIDALQCDPVARPDRTTGFIGAEGRFRTMEIRSPNNVTTPALWVATSPAAPVTVCATMFW